jgi:hypothetical protein
MQNFITLAPGLQRIRGPIFCAQVSFLRRTDQEPEHGKFARALAPLLRLRKRTGSNLGQAFLSLSFSFSLQLLPFDIYKLLTLLCLCKTFINIFSFFCICRRIYCLSFSLKNALAIFLSLHQTFCSLFLST